MEKTNNRTDIYAYFKKIKGNKQMNLNHELRKQIDTRDPRYSKYLDSPVTSSSNLTQYRSKPMHKIRPLPLPYRLQNLPRVEPIRRCSNDSYVISDDNHSLFFPRKVYNSIDQAYESSRIEIGQSSSCSINVHSVMSTIKRRISPVPSRRCFEEFSRLSILDKTRFPESARNSGKGEIRGRNSLKFVEERVRVCRKSRCLSSAIDTSSSSLSGKRIYRKMRTSISPEMDTMQDEISSLPGFGFAFPSV
jgi:hypothetical protein